MRCRRLPPPLRKKTEFHGSDQVVSGTREKKRVSKDMFELKEAFEIHPRGFRDGIAGLVVLPLASAGDEIRENLALLPGQVESVTGRNPIANPGLRCDPLAADNVGHKVAVVRIPAGIIKIPVIQEAVALKI